MTMPNLFAQTRTLLQNIHSAVDSDGLIGIAWSGSMLSVSVARPASGKRMFVMNFDMEDDFNLDADALIREFAARSRVYFESSDEI